MEHAQQSARLSILLANGGVTCSAKLNACNVLQEHGSVLATAYHDLFKLLDLLQAAKGIDLHRERRHNGSSRRCTSLSTNGLAILFIDRLVDGLWFDTKRRQFLRVHPDAHGILAQSKVRNLSNTRDALQRLNDIDISVIG